jgi:hypothetical protein
MSGGSRVGVELAVSIAPAEHLVVVAMTSERFGTTEAYFNLAQARELVEILRTAIGKLGAASPPGHA